MRTRLAVSCAVALALFASLAACSAEELAHSSTNAVSGEPSDLFSDPFPGGAREARAQREKDAAELDRFMVLQAQSQLAVATKTGTKASFTGVRNFVFQLYRRIQTEQKIADDDAKAEVLACRGSVETQRAKTLAQMKRVKRLNSSLVHETELVAELPVQIASLSTLVSKERKSALRVKHILAELNKERKQQRLEMKAKRKATLATLKAIQTMLNNIRRLPIKLRRTRRKQSVYKNIPNVPNPIAMMNSAVPPNANPPAPAPKTVSAAQKGFAASRQAAAASDPEAAVLPGDVAAQLTRQTKFRSLRADTASSAKPAKDPMADIEAELDAAQADLKLGPMNEEEDESVAAVEGPLMAGEKKIMQKLAEKGSLTDAQSDEEQDSAWLSLLELWETGMEPSEASPSANATASNATASNSTNTTAEDEFGPQVNVDLSNLRPLDADLSEVRNPALEAILNGLEEPNPDGDDPNRNPNVDPAVNRTANGTARSNTTRIIRFPPPYVKKPTPVTLDEQGLKTVKTLYSNFVHLKKSTTHYLLMLDEEAKANLKSYFAKKRLYLRNYYMHFTEYRKSGRRRHWTILRLKRARVLSKQRQASIQFHLPLFLLLKQQLATLKKGCNETEQQLALQSQQRAKTLDTITAVLKVIDDRINGVLTPSYAPPEGPTLPPVSLNAGSRNFSSCRELLVAGFTTSGVYSLSDLDTGRSFLAYCDMKTAGGGWMLAFKQSDFKSGTVRHSEKLYGAAPLLSTAFNSSSMGSIFGYGKPKQLLFRASSADNWFTTTALNPAYQYWDIQPTPRYCFYRPMHDSAEFYVSPTWSGLAIWPDTDIQLMDQEHPDISAVTIGQMMVAQKGPQCMQPHCNPNRHGRFNGECQNGSAGEGNWMIFTR